MAGRGTSTPTDIRGLVTTSDGTRLIAGAEDGSIRLRATDPLRQLDSAFAHRDGVLALAILEEKNGTFVFSAGADHHVRRWRIANDQLLDGTDLTGIIADSRVQGLAVTGRWVAAAGHDGQLRVRHHDGGRVTGGDTGIEVLAMGVAPDGRSVVVGGTRDGRGIAQVWQVNKAHVKRLYTIEPPQSKGIRSLIVVSTRSVILGGDDGALVEWDWGANNTVQFEPSHLGPVHALARVSPVTIISGSSDGRVLRWSLSSRKMLDDTGLDFPGGVFTLAAPTASAHKMIFAAGGRGQVQVLRDGVPMEPPFSGHDKAVRSITVSEKGDLVVTGSADRTARLWNESGEERGVLVGHKDTVSAVAIWPDDNSRIVTGSEDGTIMVWDRFSGEPIGAPMAHGAKVWALAVSPDGRRILSGGNDHKVKLWRADTRAQIGEPWADPRKAISAIAISGNGAYAVIGEDDGNIAFWDLENDRPDAYQNAVQDGQVRSVAIDFDGTVAVVGGQDGRITIWNVRTRSRIGDPIRTGQNEVLKVLLAKDGDTIISCAANGLVERWNRHTGMRVGQVRPEFASRTVEAIALMPDGELIVAGDSEGEIGLVRTTATPEKGPGSIDPRIPHDPPHPNPTSDEPTRDDTIGNTADVRAIAELIAARHTVAPRSLALLGDWGSGKSSTVLQIKNYVHRLATSAMPDEVASFWMCNMRQIRFNAWHYSYLDPWTGLAERLFEGLQHDPTEDPDLSRPTAPVDSGERDTLLRRQKRSTELQQEVAAEVNAAEEAKTSVLHPLALLRRMRHLLRALKRIRRYQRDEPTIRVPDQPAPRRRAAWVLGCLAGIATSALVAIMLREWIPHAYGWLVSVGVGAAGVVTAVTAGLSRFARFTAKLPTQLREAVAEEVDQATRKREEQDPAYRLDMMLTRLTTSDTYAPHRGVVGEVHHDLCKLADALDRANRASETPAVDRIVLYIDDLDRCAPDRVVEVLQAVNLLMSMSIFIVVVAADPQWLFQALVTVHGKAFDDERDAHRHALGLLDKVFNLVYTMRPLGIRRSNYLMSLVDNIERDRPSALPLIRTEQTPRLRPAPVHSTRSVAPGKPQRHSKYEPPAPRPWDPPNRALRISQQEIDLLVCLTELLNGPRAVKKLTNIYRLILMDEQHRRTDYLKEDYQAAAIMAAGLVHAPGEFAHLINQLNANGEPHRDIVQVLDTADEQCRALATSLSRCVARHVAETPALLRYADRYRDWSCRVARYSFETYRQYTAG